MREDLSSGFTTMQVSNQPAQLQRVHVARKLNFACSKFFNYTFKRANNKGTDQTARMCRLGARLFVENPFVEYDCKSNTTLGRKKRPKATLGRFFYERSTTLGRKKSTKSDTWSIFL